MPTINIDIKNKIATADETEYICGNDDFIVAFAFDAEWDEHPTKTARFVWDKGYQDIVFQGSQCEVPVISNTGTILCGVFTGNLKTTTPAMIRAKKSILCGNPPPAEATPTVFEQMLTLFNAGLDESRANVAAAEAYAKEAAGYADFDWFPRFWHEQYEGVVISEWTLDWVGTYGVTVNGTVYDKGSERLNLGDTVVVYWDGEAFECMVKEYVYSSNARNVYIGNFGMKHNVDGMDTEEPFYISLVDASGNGQFVIFPQTLGEHTFSVYAVEKKNLLPDKFLSGTVVKNGDKELILASPDGTRFKITVNNDGTLAAAAVNE